MELLAKRRVCKNEAICSIRGPLVQISAATGFSFSAPFIDSSPCLLAWGGGSAAEITKQPRPDRKLGMKMKESLRFHLQGSIRRSVVAVIDREYLREQKRSIIGVDR